MKTEKLPYAAATAAASILPGKRLCIQCRNDISSQPLTHHYCPQCFAAGTNDSGDSSEDGDSLEDSGWACRYCAREFGTKKGAIFHENFHCKAKGHGQGRGRGWGSGKRWYS